MSSLTPSTTPSRSTSLLGVTVAGLVALSAVQRRELVAARHDPLTGLFTRQAWTVQAMRRLARGGLVVLLVDLDGFKDVNDTYGHAAGDAVLAAVGARLQGWHPQGLAARLGGDEFVAVLPPAAADDLRGLHQVLTAPITYAGAGHREQLAVGASIGASLAPRGSALSEALAAADHAMYAAKTTRRPTTDAGQTGQARGGGLRVRVAGGADLVPATAGRWRRHRPALLFPQLRKAA